MRGVSQFAELIDSCRVLVEHHERQVDGCQIERGIRAAEPAEAGVGRGRRVDWKQMQDPAAQEVQDVREVLDEIANFARGGQDGVTVLLDLADLSFDLLILRVQSAPGPAEQARKCAVNRVAGAVRVRVDRDSNVRAFGPELPALRIEQKSFWP